MPGLATVHRTSASPPRGTTPGRSRCTVIVAGGTARAQSTIAAASRAVSTNHKTAAGHGDANTTTDATAANTTNRAVGTGITPSHSNW